MASEFGPHFMQPIQDRLLHEFTHLTKDQLDLYDKICAQVRDEAHHFVYQQMEKLLTQGKTISKSWSYAQFEVHMKAKYPLINDENLSHLYSQGCYFCWKDGMISPLENA